MPTLNRKLIVAFLLGSAGLMPARAADFFIAPNGADSAPGSRQQPFATFQKAQEAVQRSRRQRPAEPATVWLAGGNYFLDKPIALTGSDSGTASAPTCYRPLAGQTPVLTNSRRLTARDFKTVVDPAALARIPDAARGRIVALDLKALGIKHNTPPPAVFTDSGNMPSLYFNGRRMALSRFPKSGFMTMKTVLQNGENRGAPGIFEYREEHYDNYARWKRAEGRGIWLKGYWRVMWGNEAIRIQTIDTTAHTVTFAQGIAGGIGSKYHRPHGNGSEQYWLLNLLEEVSQPGEFCIDYQDQKLYFFPPEPLDKAQVYLGDSDQPMVEISDASHITIRGLTFEYAMGDALVIKGGSNNLVAGCTIRNVDKYAIRVKGGTGHTVLSSDLYHLGEGGVFLAGGDENSTPRKPAGHKVVNNHIHHFSEIVKVYTPAVNCGSAEGSAHFSCVGNLVAHNLIHDTPHGGILFGSWDNVFEYNEIFRFCLTSNDLGGFYSYGRYDWMGNATFRYNLLHGSAQGDGIYFDWDHRDMHIYGNIVFLQSQTKRGHGILYKVGTQTDPKFSTDPANAQPLDCHDNIAVKCDTGFSFVVPAGSVSRIENNVAVDCRVPWSYSVIANGKVAKAPDGPVLEKNRSYTGDPGFVDMARLNFALKPGSQVLKDLPSFKPIPVEKIGLFKDEYRTSLPTDAEIDRFSQRTSIGREGYSIEDRK